MAFDYSALRDGPVASVIENLGQAMTLSQTALSTFDPETEPVETVTNTAVRGAVTAYSEADIDGTVIRRTDRKVILDAELTAAAGVVPSENDELIVGGVTYKVIHVEPVSPAGVAVVYELQVRA